MNKKVKKFTTKFIFSFITLVGSFQFFTSSSAYATEVNVTNWTEFVSALQTPGVSELNIKNDITKPNGGAIPGTIARDLVINGNGNAVNFFTGTPNGIVLGDVSRPTSLIVKNVDFSKYTTPGTAVFSGVGSNWMIDLENVTTGARTTGAQSAIVSAAGATVNISGTNNFRMNSAASVPHIQAETVNIKDDAQVMFNTSALINGGAFQGTTFTIGKNAKVDLGTSSVNGNRSNNVYGINATGAVSVGENSQLSANSSANYSTMIVAGTFSSQSGSKIDINNSGSDTVQLDVKGNIDIQSGSTLEMKASGSTTTQIKTTAEEFIVQKGANVNLDYTYASNATSYSFYGNKFIVADEAELKMNTNGSGHRIYGTGMTIGKSANVEISSGGASDAMIYLINNAKILVDESANVQLENKGTTATVNPSSGDQGSHVIFGTITDFTVKKDANVTMKSNYISYWTQAKNSFNMTDGAKVRAYSKNREAICLASDFGDGANADTPATINISGEGTLLDMSSDNTDFTVNQGATMRVQGDGSTFNLSDKAELRSSNRRTSALQMQSKGSKFNVSSGAKMFLSKDGTDVRDYNIGAALRFRIRGEQTFNIDNGEVYVNSKGTTSAAIRMYGDNNAINVENSGKLVVRNEGNQSNIDDSDNAGIQYTSGSSSSTQVFNLTGKKSMVDVQANVGPAIISASSSDFSAKVGEHAIFILNGTTRSQNRGGAIQANDKLEFVLDNPLYFDLRNSRVGGGYTFTSGRNTSQMVSKNSDLSVWKIGSNLEGDPYRAWSIFDYTLTNASFNKIVSTNIPSEFNNSEDSYGPNGASGYSRMSANNASAVVDELRVPTDADKYIFGHVRIPEGLEDGRDAWTDEVYVTVLVKNANGTKAFEATGVTVGKNDKSPGLVAYEDDARGGMFKIPVPDDKFLTADMTIDVIAAWRGNEDPNSTRIHVSTPDDFLAPERKVLDVTPPTPTKLTDGNLNNATKVLSGKDAEANATVYVYYNTGDKDTGTLLGTSTVLADGTWSYNVPSYVEKTKELSVYLEDTAGKHPAAELVPKDPTDPAGEQVYDQIGLIKPPVTNTATGNINPYNDLAYHDAVFKGVKKYAVGDVIPDEPKVVKTVSSSGGTVSSVGDVLSYSVKVKNDKSDSYAWTDIKVIDALQEGLVYDSTKANIKIDGLAVDESKVSFDSATNTLSIGIGDLSAGKEVTVTFDVIVGQKAVDKEVKNKAIALGYSPQESPFVPGPKNPSTTHVEIQGESDEVSSGTIKGVLAFVSGPKTIDFGKKMMEAQPLRVDNPTYSEDLVVLDNRGTLKNWTVTVAVKKPMTSEDGSNTLTQAIRFSKNGQENILDGNAYDVFSHKHDSPGEFNVSNVWKNSGDGFKFEVPPTKISALGKYTAILEWNLGDTP